MNKNDIYNKIAEIEKDVASLKQQFNNSRFSDLEVGDTFTLADVGWTILDTTDKGYVCLADCIEKRKFDEESNNWCNSELRKYLNSVFYQKICDEIGKDNVISINRELLSLDGQTEYGNACDSVSLITVDEYRKYRKLIPNVDDYWWWMCSPWSTVCNGYEYSVAVVSPSGYVYDLNCSNCYGVRPFCIFSSELFES